MTTTDVGFPLRVLAIHEDVLVLEAIEQALADVPHTTVTTATEAPSVGAVERPDVVFGSRSAVGALGGPTEDSQPSFVVLLRSDGDDRLDGSDDEASPVDDVLELPVDGRRLVMRLRTARRVVMRERRLWEAARRDPVTGLPNRLACEEELVREMRRAVRSELALTCALLDLDRFKRINDGRGHLAGDGVLAEVANVIARSVRPGDFLGRYGGDEFLVLLPETALDEARRCCERVLAAVANAEASDGGGSLPTFTVGLAECGPNTPAPADLLLTADANLRAGKLAGGSRVEPAE